MSAGDIALFLLERGARMDIFAVAMLGHLEIVRAMLAAVPDARNWRGPHGIPLLTHAEMGGAAAVVEFLKGIDVSSSPHGAKRNAGQVSPAHG